MRVCECVRASACVRVCVRLLVFSQLCLFNFAARERTHVKRKRGLCVRVCVRVRVFSQHTHGGARAFIRARDLIQHKQQEKRTEYGMKLNTKYVFLINIVLRKS